MSRKKGEYKIPYDRYGNPMHYPENDYAFNEETKEYTPVPPYWRDNVEFEATFRFDTYGRGRSSAVIYFKDEKGVRYTMFMSDFDKVAPLMVKGVVSGLWHHVKCGQNYGVYLKEERA